MASRQGSRTGSGRTVCVIASHPLVLRNVEHALAGSAFRLRLNRIDASPARTIDDPPRAPLYLIDGQLPRSTTESVVSMIGERFPNARVLVAAERIREPEAFALLRLGVKGLVPYAELESSLAQALDTVARGGVWVPRRLLSRFLDAIIARSPRRVAASSAAVSLREREVLELVLQGLSNKQIADRLHISERTVKFHVSNLLAKLELKSRHELIRHFLSDVPYPGSTDAPVP